MHTPLPEPDRPAALLQTVEAAELQLDTALQLLARANHVWPPQAQPGSAEWLQSLIDGLCTLSSRDPLTGLLNRRQLLLVLDREVDRVARAGGNALLLVLDIDHFKQVNDRHGHPAGDAVLSCVSRVLQRSVRPMDTVARIGGEEFAIVLPNCAPMFGPGVADRIRSNIERCVVEITAMLTLQVTISIGGAYAPPWVRSTSGLWLQRADQLLYQAKSSGRNCARLEQPPSTELSREERGMLLSGLDEDDPSEPPPESAR